MMEMGWNNVNQAWIEVQSIIDDVEALAFKGWNILNNLEDAKQGLLKNGLVQAATTPTTNSTTNQTITTFATWCPNSMQNQTDSRFHFLKEAINQVESNADEIAKAFEFYIPKNSHRGFEVITKMTNQVDESISWFFSHDWIWKLLLMIINVLTVIMLLACYFITKQDIIHDPSRYYLSWFILPLFIIFTGVFLITALSAGVATMVNADFCSGGGDDYNPSSDASYLNIGMEGGSPLGTIEDAILSFQFGSLERQPLPDGRLQLVYDSFIYFSNVRVYNMVTVTRNARGNVCLQFVVSPPSLKLQLSFFSSLSRDA